MKFMVRAFVSNSGCAYDPAPLEEFDFDTIESNGFIPSVGDVIQWDETKLGYRVIDRFFNFSLEQCKLIVEEISNRANST